MAKHQNLRELWVSAKTENPLLTRAQFAVDVGRNIRTVHGALVGLEKNDRAILSAHIAAKIAECAEEQGTNPCDVDWATFRQWSAFAYGKNNCEIASKHITLAGGFNVVRDAHYPQKPGANVERLRNRAASNYNRRLGAAFARQQYVLESIEGFADRVFSGRIEASKKTAKTPSKIERAIHAVWSDLHFGSDLSAEETASHTFGRVEEARRMAQITKAISEFKQEHRARTRLHVWLLGDLIQNQLHDHRDGAVISEQICRAIHCLSQSLAYLSRHFHSIDVHCSPGNHGRFTSRHQGRATNQKFDAIETVIAYSLAASFRTIKHVKFNIPKQPFASIQSLGVGYFGTHGDTVFHPGNPGQSVNSQALEAQINRMNADFAHTQKGHKNSVFLCGHVHQPTLLHLGNGASVVINGALVPSDHYAGSLGRFSNAAGQWVFEQTPGHPVGDSRFLRVGPEHDSDARLDKIISPWENFAG